MALTGTFKTPSYKYTVESKTRYRYYQITWTATQSIANNQSTLNWKIVAMDSSTQLMESKGQLFVNGASVFYDTGHRYRRGTSDPNTTNTDYILWQGVSYINHDTNGNASFTAKFQIDLGSTTGSVNTISDTYTFQLNQIPRASVITASTSEVVVNGSNSHTVAWSPYVASYSHKVTWSIGSYSSSKTVNAGTNSASLAISKEWLRAIPSATSGTATVKVETYNGSTLIGSAQTKTFVIKTDGSEKPSYALYASDANGYYDKISAYIINLSKIKVDVRNISYQYGASLKSISVTIGSATYTGTSTSVTAQSNINASSTVCKVTLTDSRGYSYTESFTITAYAYSTPSIALDISRYSAVGVKDDEGGMGRVAWTASVSKIGNNSLQSIKIDWVAADGQGSGTVTKYTETGEHYVTADTEKVYIFTVAIADKLNTVVYRKQMSSAVTIMDIIAGGDGVCFGGVATKHNYFDVRWRANFANGLDSLPFIVGTVIPDSADLNAYTSVGKYSVPTTRSAGTMRNHPNGTAGCLYVITGMGGDYKDITGAWKYMLQIYVTYLGAISTRYMSTDSTGMIEYGSWQHFARQ